MLRAEFGVRARSGSSCSSSRHGARPGTEWRRRAAWTRCVLCPAAVNCVQGGLADGQEGEGDALDTLGRTELRQFYLVHVGVARWARLPYAVVMAMKGKGAEGCHEVQGGCGDAEVIKWRSVDDLVHENGSMGTVSSSSPQPVRQNALKKNIFEF